jgi:hypothetical protein
MPNKPLTGPVILNNTPLVALWSLNQLKLLHDLYGEVIIPLAVNEEFLATERSVRQTALADAPWLKITGSDGCCRCLYYPCARPAMNRRAIHRTFAKVKPSQLTIS